jgi:hypothetical protein
MSTHLAATTTRWNQIGHGVLNMVLGPTKLQQTRMKGSTIVSAPKWRGMVSFVATF